MYRLLGYSTQNTMKTLYVLEELGVEYEFQFVDLFKGEQKTEAFLKLNPVGKAPVLQMDDDSLFESGAICRYVANVENSPLYPQDKLQRAKVDQWMDYFTCHLGRFINTLYFENHIKPKAGMGEASPSACEEAMKFALQQLPIVDGCLKETGYFVGNSLTIADLCAFAYLEQSKSVDLSLGAYPNIKAWYDRIAKRECIGRARDRLNP